MRGVCVCACALATRSSRPRRERTRVALEVSTSGSSSSGLGIAGAMSVAHVVNTNIGHTNADKVLDWPIDGGPPHGDIRAQIEQARKTKGVVQTPSALSHRQKRRCPPISSHGTPSLLNASLVASPARPPPLTSTVMLHPASNLVSK